MNVIGKFRKPMVRQLTEAVLINNTPKQELLNLKNEYFKNKVDHLQISNEDCICKKCGLKCNNKDELFDHIRGFHQRFKCDYCEYTSFGSKDLKFHIETVHSDKGPGALKMQTV